MPETNAQLSLGSVQSILATVVAKSQECEIQVWWWVGLSDLEVCCFSCFSANVSYRPVVAVTSVCVRV